MAAAGELTGGTASSDLSSLAAGRLGFQGEVREYGEGLKRAGSRSLIGGWYCPD